MALSGTIYGSFGGTDASNVRPIIEWKATQNISKNTSTVTATLVFLKGNSYWYPFNLAGHNVSMSINGNSASSSRTFDLRSTSRYEVWSRSVTVNHNGDGRKTINISASGTTGTNVGGYNVSQNVDLNTIPRSSSMSISPTTADFGSTIKFNISRASGSFTHTINYNINGQGGNVITKTGSTTPTWTIPLDLMKHSPNSTSSKINIWLDTYSGNTKIGVVQYSITANVPSNILPSITSFTAAEVEPRLGVIGLPSNNFLQGNSRIYFSSSVSAGLGANLTKTTIAIDGVTSFEGRDGVVTLAGLTGHYGSKTARVTVTDSRGRSSSRTLGIVIHGYAAPKIALFEAKRNKTNVNIKKSCSYTAVGQNTLTYSLTRTGGVKVGDITHGQNDYSFGGYAANHSFVFTLTITDKLNKSTSVSTISTEKQLMHIDQDAGFGIGKYREKGILDVLGDTYIDGNIEVSQGAVISGGLSVPGGFVSLLVPSGSDLNSYVTPGFYHNPSSGSVETIKNTVENYAFSLLVERHAGTKQTLTIFRTDYQRTYVRNQYNGSWGNWVSMGGESMDAEINPANGWNKYSTGLGSAETPRVRRRGNVVCLTGAFTNKTVHKASDSSSMGTIPGWARPNNNEVIRSRNQGTGSNTYMLEVYGNGDLVISRYGSADRYKDCQAGSWLLIDCCYLVDATY